MILFLCFLLNRSSFRAILKVVIVIVMLLFQRYSKLLVGDEVDIFQKKSILQHFLTHRQDFYQNLVSKWRRRRLGHICCGWSGKRSVGLCR